MGEIAAVIADSRPPKAGMLDIIAENIYRFPNISMLLHNTAHVQRYHVAAVISINFNQRD